MRRVATYALGALVVALGLIQPCRAQEPGSDDRIRMLEEQNRAILRRLEAAESRNQVLETEIKTIRTEGVDPRASALETQVNTLSSKLGDGITYKQLTRSGFPIKFYGFVRLDAYYNTARMDSTIVPF